MTETMAMFALGISILCTALLCINGQSYTMVVKEGRPASTFVGNVQSDPQYLIALQSVDKTNLKFMFFGQKGPLVRNFRIEDTSGAIYTTEQLDRETLCPELMDCFLDLDVAVYSEAAFKIFKVRIVIDDVNDNSPEFPEHEVTINVPESVAINFSVPLSGASDADTGENNGVRNYEIIPSNGQFGVSVIQNLDGAPEVGVVVLKKLDREVTSSYQVKIVAKDGGAPQMTGTVSVTILVTDVNDHAPVFTQSVYNITIEENYSLKTPIVQVLAQDKDTGKNGQVKYRYSSRTVSKYPDLFSINDTTGEIRVIGNVDYEQTTGKLFRLVVEALDQALQPRSSQALVIVNLIDVNDNAPTIDYNFLPEGDRAVISENARLHDFVAHISVVDLDSERNAEVDCRIRGSEFKLDRLYDNEFQVNLNSKLDRELTSEYNVSLQCEDKGSPSFSVSSYFIVSVGDENDNSPEFMLPSYVVPVKESAKVGEGILQVKAVDKDVDRNGRISYAVFGTNSSHFRIDPSNGMLYIREQVDYEATPEMTITVRAGDAGLTPRYSNVTVVIKISDVNDEKPKFNQTAYRFNLIEEQPSGAIVGEVLALDPDQGLGGQLEYFLQETPESKGMFLISADDGVIRTTRKIDREATPTVHFFVVASDKGDNPLTSTVGVTVDLEDINDNSPDVRVPFVFNGTFPVYTTQPANRPFIKVVATDPDNGENGSLSYMIKDGDRHKIFYMNPDNGDMFLKLNKSERKEISSREDVSLLISVKDLGSPQRVTLKRLNLTVIPANASRVAPKKTEGVPSNYVIVIGVICATTFISLIIIIIIFVIRRRNLREAAETSTDSIDKFSKNDISKESNGTNSSKQLTKNNHVNGKSKKGVNFVIENDGGLLSDESTTDPIVKMPMRQTAPHHDVIRGQQTIGKPTSLNLIWMDEKPESNRSPIDSGLSYNVISPNKIPQSAKVWLHDPRGDGVLERTRRPDDETSNVSGETVTSDSGRGGSEEDSHSRHHYSIDEQDGFPRGSMKELSAEGEYVDMQRSALSYMKKQGQHHSLPDHYNNIIRGSAHSHNDSGLNPGSTEYKPEQQDYTKMSPINSMDLVTSLPPPIPPRYRRLPNSAEKNKRSNSRMHEPVVKINVSRICRSGGRSEQFNGSVVTDSDLTTCDDSDSATTTSGSYTIDDLSDCDSRGFETANV